MAILMSEPRPDYVATSQGQLRIWQVGGGPDLVVLPGLALGARARAAQWALAAPGRRVTAIDPPGLGGSDGDSSSYARMAEAIIEAVAQLTLADFILAAHDLSVPLLAEVARRLGLRQERALGVEWERARGWIATRANAPDTAPRGDGTHLTALFAHLRDCHVLDPADRRWPAKFGAALPSAADLDEAVVGFAARPGVYEKHWQLGVAAARSFVPEAGGVTLVAAVGEGIVRGSGLRGKEAAVPAAVPPASCEGPWRGYVDLSRGRAHVLRQGRNGRPLLVFQSAPGSCAPLHAVIDHLAQTHQVIAADYLGNGDSSKPEGTVSIARLAADALELADALGLDDFDVWGTHTGAVVGLELSILAPRRVHAQVLEAPPILSKGFSADILANYLPPLLPDKWGLHLQQAWNMRRDMFLFWPWYRAEREAVRPLGLPDTDFLHDWTIGLLKSGCTYDRSYRAAFEYPTAERLPLVSRPTLITAGPSDMLVEALAAARRIAPACVEISSSPATVWYPNQPPEGVRATLEGYGAFLARHAA